MADQKKILLVTDDKFFDQYLVTALEEHFGIEPKICTSTQARDMQLDNVKCHDAIILCHPHTVPRIYEDEQRFDAAATLLKQLRQKAGNRMPILCAALPPSMDRDIMAMTQKLNGQNISFVDNDTRKIPSAIETVIQNSPRK